MTRLALLLTLLAAPAFAGGETSALIIKSDSGGNVLNYAAKIARHTGPARIIGICQSSCTMWLKVACVSPKARLMFHAPGHPLRKLTAHEHRATVSLIVSHYPPAIRGWYLDQFAAPGNPRKAWMDYETVVALGARPCGE